MVCPMNPLQEGKVMVELRFYNEDAANCVKYGSRVSMGAILIAQAAHDPDI